MDTLRRGVAWPALSPDLSPNDHFFVCFERDSRRIGFVILLSLSTLQQICHVIPWLTARSHSTAQVPCLFFALTCSDVTIGPPFFCNFSSWKVTCLQLSHFESHLGCPTYQLDPGVAFSKMARRNNWTTPFSRPKTTYQPDPLQFGLR